MTFNFSTEIIDTQSLRHDDIMLILSTVCQFIINLFPITCLVLGSANTPQLATAVVVERPTVVQN